jgi:hypothetical protein
MLIIQTKGSGTEEACWRYAYMIPTQEVLDELTEKMPGTYVTEVCLVFFEADHAALHEFFDAKFPQVAALEKTETRRHLNIVRDARQSER